MFLRNRRPAAITLRAYTSAPGLVDTLAPVRLAQALPSWWTQLPAYVEEPAREGGSQEGPRPQLMSAKHCFSFHEMFRLGIGLKLWADVQIFVLRDKVIASSPQPLRAGMIHPEVQHAGAIASNGQHFKIHSPWTFVCEYPVRFLLCHAFYHQPDQFRFQLMPGILEFCNQHKTHLNIVIPRHLDHANTVSLDAGEFVAYLFPLEDVAVKLVAEQVTQPDIERINFADKVSNRPFLFRRKFSIPPFIIKRRRPRE